MNIFKEKEDGSFICKNCSNKDICKYLESFGSEQVMEMTKKLPEPFMISCAHWRFESGYGLLPVSNCCK